MTTDYRAAQLAAMRQAESNYHKMADACPWHCPQNHVHTVAILRDMHLDAVYPLIEQEVREQVAKEIEAKTDRAAQIEAIGDLLESWAVYRARGYPAHQIRDAVYPLIEQEVREQVAKEIEAKCLQEIHTTEWVGYEMTIVCLDCQLMSDFARGKPNE
jgi:hypothetical protein